MTSTMEPSTTVSLDSKDELGLLVLYPPPPSAGQLPVVDESPPEGEDVEPAFDIVAVHGLNGHRTKSWTSSSEGQAQDGKKILWLRDMLPGLVRDVRVMTFGWDWKANSNTTTAARKAGRLTSVPPAPTSESGIRQTAVKLLDELIKSAKDSTAPLIFVCHSFGGIIVKKLLVIANNDEAYLSIAERTKLLIFFGTPHRPSSTSSWGDLLFDIALSSAGQLPTCRRELLESVLQVGMADVVKTTKGFRSLSAQYQILSFYEREKEGFMGKVIVPEPSACMAVAQEKCLPRGGSSTHLTLHHFFPGNKNDESQLNLIAALCHRSAGDSRHTTHFTLSEFEQFLACRRKFLRWSQPVIAAQSHAARARGNWLQGTLGWLYHGRSQHEECMPVAVEGNPSTLKFAKLLCDNTASAGPTLLHVTGRAGTGKTVLAAYLCDTLAQNFVAKSMLNLEAGQPSALDAEPPIIVSFFFSACDNRLQSSRGMLVSLLSQLLSYGPEAYRSIHSQYGELTHRYTQGRSDLCIGWTDEDLWCLLRAVIACRELPQVVCIVDAIDEGKDYHDRGHGNAMKLLELVEKIIKLRTQTGKAFKFVFTTRGPHAKSKVASMLSESVASLAAAGERGASVDLDSCEEAKLDKDMFISARVAAMAEEDPLVTVRLKEFLASRTLLELDLLLPSYSSHVPIGMPYRSSRISLAMTLINELSPLGDSAYIDSICDYILSAIATERRTWAHDVLSCLLFAKRPLRTGELSAFLSVVKGGQPQHTPQSVFQARFCEDMRTALHHVFGPLIIIDEHGSSSGGGDEYAATGTHVHFRHPTIKHYLLHQGDDAAGDLFCYTNKPRWHKELAMRCLTYLRDHFRENPKSPCRRTREDPDLVLTQNSEPQAAGQMGKSANHRVGAGAPVHGHDDRLSGQVVALAYAARYWPSHFKEAMSLGWGEPSSLELIELALEVIGWHSAPAATGLTSWWAEWYISSDDRALPSPDDSLLGDDGLWNSAINIAAHLGLVGIYTSLCSQNPNDTQSCFSALPLAAESGQVCVVQEILGLRAPGVAPEAAAHDLGDGKGSTGSASNICRDVMVDALQKACKAGHGDIAAIVLRALKDEVKDKGYGPEEVGLPLTLPVDQCLAEAASRGHTEVVQILLAENTDVNKMIFLPDGHFRKPAAPLHYAAKYGYDSTVAALLAANADISLAAASFLPIHYAAEKGHFVLVQMLLSVEGADVDTNWKTKPLHLASENGHLASVRELLKKDPKLDTMASIGWPALVYAIYNGHLLVVRELLNAGADTSIATSGVRLTPLFIACSQNRVGIVELLLESGADPDAVSHDRLRPLHAAVANGNELIVRALLENGAFADPTTEGKKNTPLHFACRYRIPVHIVQLLFDNNADLKKKTASGETPLSLAVCKGNITTVKFLMKHGANLSDFGESERIFFHPTVSGEAKMLEIMLEHFKLESIKPRDSWGRTLLDVALTPAVRELLIPPERQKADLARNMCRHSDGKVGFVYTCDLCEKTIKEFWFHCCTCTALPTVKSTYEICQDCNRCDGGEDHRSNWVTVCYPDGASASLSTLSPWVKTMRYPDPAGSDD